jgi:mannose-6-phosphate isomerase-like protein (cupin superfamily)
MNTGPYDLSKTPIHIASVEDVPDTAVAIEGFGFDGESFGQYIQTHCSDEAPGRLVMIEESPADWGAWECHTKGEELVIVLEGEGVFMQQIGGETVKIPFKGGDTFINPRGVWHTANVTQPMRAIYITPCPGTEHRPRD